MFENSFANRVRHKALWALVLPLCLLWSLATAWQRPDAAALEYNSAAREFPTHWQGRTLRPLALSEIEKRFARQFPGTLSRLTDGHQALVLRHVDKPTRMLHPATDCYQGLGYRIAAQQLERDPQGRLWRCFEAYLDGQALRVCERITDAAGQGFTDTSAWYWAAIMGQSTGPWQAITVATPL